LETLRLYPPVWCIPRQTLNADELGGYPIPANSTVVILPYLTHRHPDFWDNPEAFDPDRFLPERSEGRPKFAFFPFGGGPRLCIGHAFSTMEAQIILAMATQRYRVHLVADQPIELSQSLTLRPRHGLKVTLEPRAA
jgi:cytochrome P450